MSTNTNTPEPVIVQALFSFKGTNNDELCFKKGDKITVTQKEEGGWWEGTLGDKTGWFPNNYVKEIKDVTTPALSPVSQQRQYRAVVLKDLIDSEKAHVTELQGLVKTFLKPLEKSSILSGDEYKQLTGNINEVVDTHQQLLELLEECESKPSNEQRVGKLFLSWASRIKSVHQAYCSMHPRAVCVLDLHKDDLATYMESCGAVTPGLLVLTTGLSKPFRRLDKYSGMLQELERHVELNHPDRGDTQRSVAIYKEIAATCAATRRQKELELQVLTGPVRGWEGQSLAQLGDILHMGSVAVGPQHQDRYLVLFPNTLLVLSVSQRMSAFIYEGKLPLTGIVVTRLEDTETYKNAFEISGPMIEKIVAICQSKEEANHWVDLLRNHTKGHHKTPPPVSISDSAPTPPPHLDRRGYSVRSSVITYSYIPPYKSVLPPYFYPPASPYSTLTKSFCRLVKEKVITHRLLERLLHPEFVSFKQNFDLSQVRVRHHKTECYIKTHTYTTKSDSESDSDSDTSEESSDEDSEEENDKVQWRRQNAVMINSSGDNSSDCDCDSVSGSGTGSVESNPFGFIRYYSPRNEEKEESAKSSQTFIDHGVSVLQPSIIAEDFGRNRKFILVGRPKSGSFPQEEEVEACRSSKRNIADQSFLEGEENTRTVKCKMDSHRESQKSESEASENLLNKKPAVVNQISQESSASSGFECGTKPYLACEDLLNIDESLEIEQTLGVPQYIPRTRQSLPTKFVGNKFNKSSSTLVYIPQWQSNSEINLTSGFRPQSESLSRSRSRSGSRSSSEETTTHSSCLDLPGNPIPVPDSVVAEILYGDTVSIPSDSFEHNMDFSSEMEDVKHELRPPLMFRNPSQVNSAASASPKSPASPCFSTRSNFSFKMKTGEKEHGGGEESVEVSGLSLRLSNVSFNKHSLNSDKPRRSQDSSEMDRPCAAKGAQIADFTPGLEPGRNQESSFAPESRSVNSRTCDRSRRKSEAGRSFDFVETDRSQLEFCSSVKVSPIESKRKNQEYCSSGHKDEFESDSSSFTPRTYRKIIVGSTSLKVSNLAGGRTSSDDSSSFTFSSSFARDNRDGTTKVTSSEDSSSPFFSPKLVVNTQSVCNNKPKIRRRRSSIQEYQPLILPKRKTINSLRKCVSYHYLTLTPSSPGVGSGHYCRCSTEPCYSRRSSDSGMAGSCTLNSPDLPLGPISTSLLGDHCYSLTDVPNIFTECSLFSTCLEERDTVSLSEIEAQHFEAQCRCTSPFGSTPRTSCQASTSENILVSARESTTSATSTKSSGSGASPFPPHPWESEKQIYEKVMSMKGQERNLARKVDKEQQWNPINPSKSKSCSDFRRQANLVAGSSIEGQEEVVVEAEEGKSEQIFRSGLYAHWWMKAKLPNEVIRGILEEAKSSAADVTTSDNANRLAGGNNSKRRANRK